MAELQRRGLLASSQMAPGSVEFLHKPFSPNQFPHRVQARLK